MPNEPADHLSGPTSSAATYRALSCRTVASEGFRTLNYVRNLPAIPMEERLGLPTDEIGITPSESLLMALGACLSARIRANALNGSITVQSLTLEIEANVEKSPLWGTVHASQVGFEAIHVRVLLEADAPADALRALIAHALLWSPVANTIYSPVHLDVALAEDGVE